jgi:winged helix DNA-binding protein
VGAGATASPKVARTVARQSLPGAGDDNGAVAADILRVTPAQVLRYRARTSHLDGKLPAGSFAEAAWGGLQDTVPRGGVLSLHARVSRTRPDSWDDPSLVQIWFRGGADYLVPRVDVGIFTLGSYPRDPAKARDLEALADDIDRITGGQSRNSSDLPETLGGRRLRYRSAAMTGRVHIRWDARETWVIPVPRPSMDPEDARRELARRFFGWFGPATLQQLTRWTGVEPPDARMTFEAIRPELESIEIDGPEADGPAGRGSRFLLRPDVDALRTAAPIAGVRLLPQDDPLTKLDHVWLVPDETVRLRALPKVGRSPGYIPGAVLVDGVVVGGWQRQGRTVTVHPFGPLAPTTRAAIDAEALAIPIAGPGEATVRFSP